MEKSSRPGIRKSSFKYSTTAFIKSWLEPAQRWAYDVPYGSLQRETHHSHWIVGAMQEGVADRLI